MDKLIVTISGISLIAAIYWFFFGKRGEDHMDASDTWNITVDGGYQPNIIRLVAGKPATITFTRKDANSCLEEVIFPDYKIKEYLPLGKPVTIALPPPHKTATGFHCSMNMFHGRIEVLNPGP